MTSHRKKPDGLHLLRVACLVVGGALVWALLILWAGTDARDQVPEKPPTIVQEATATVPPTATTAATPTPPSVRYSSCEEAANAGVPLPIPTGHTGYRPELDRNRNGLACE